MMLSRLTINDLNRNTLLCNVNFSLEAGECACLSGESGSGKTLLLRAIADLDPNQGEVLLNGKSRHEYAPDQWRSRVTLVPSDPQWWGHTVGEHFKQMNAELLADLGFSKAALGWEVSRLSSGERQRLAIIRAIVNEPEVLLLDEPTANLDEENAMRVEALLLRVARDHSVALLWVSHSRAQIDRIADSQLHMAKGQVYEVSHK